MKLIPIGFSILLLFCQPLRAGLPSGYVVGWGFNSPGEVTGVASHHEFIAGLVTIGGRVLSNAVAVAAGNDGALALRDDGTVAAWGASEAGQTGVWVGLSNVVAIATGGYDSLAFKKDGTVAVWGPYLTSEDQVGLSNVVAVSYRLKLGSDGRLVSRGTKKTQGSATIDRAAFVPAAFSNVVAFSEYAGDGVVVRRDGTVAQWNLNGRTDVERQPWIVTNGMVIAWRVRDAEFVEIDGLSNVVAIAESEGHVLALKNNGTVFGWGNNGSGEATGSRETNSPVRWGPHFLDSSQGLVKIAGQVLDDVKAIAASPHFSMALKNDGTIVGWGSSPQHWMDPPAGLSNVVAIAAGYNYCLAITTNRTIAEKFLHKE